MEVRENERRAGSENRRLIFRKRRSCDNKDRKSEGIA
jgi:hypothetical protein